jgi:hypothetical protein
MKINNGTAVSVIVKKKWLEAWMGYNIDVEIIQSN